MPAKEVFTSIGLSAFEKKLVSLRTVDTLKSYPGLLTTRISFELEKSVLSRRFMLKPLCALKGISIKIAFLDILDPKWGFSNLIDETYLLFRMFMRFCLWVFLY